MTNHDAIRTWLLDRLNEDEQLVAEINRQRADYGEKMDGGWNLWGHFGQLVDRMIRGCETRTPREVAAKRRRLERHTYAAWRPAYPGYLPIHRDGSRAAITAYCEWCSETSNREEWFYTSWPCPDLVDDAQSWAGRDDMPEELRLK